MSRYLDSKHLENLALYKYQSVDLSPVSNRILKPWWEFVARLMPPHVAPNTITLVGFACIIFNVLVVIVLMPDLEGPIGSFWYFLFAFGMFWYQTMDNVDGKQARKTGSSSPLGELFDHCIDSLNCPLGGLIHAASMGLGHTPYTIFLVLIACWPMYLSQWEEWHTGVLFLDYINGPTEGVLIAISVMLISGIKGPWYWSNTLNLPSWLSKLLFLPRPATYTDLFMIFVLLGLVVGHAPSCFDHVYKATQQRKARVVHLSEAIWQLVPLMFFSASAGLWSRSPLSCVLSEQRTIEFALIICFSFGHLSTRIILSHLTKGSFPGVTKSHIPLAVGALLVNLPYIGFPTLLPHSLEKWCLHAVLLFSFVNFSAQAVEIIETFCRHLNIKCFSIPNVRRL